MKYQIMIHMKDDLYVPAKGDEENSLAGYIISYKGIFDTLNEAFDYIYNKYKTLLRERHIALEQLANHMTITRIDPELCHKWENLYLKEKVK